MADLAKLQAGYARLKQGTLWSSTGRCKGYAASNPSEAAAIDAYVAALVGGHAASPPSLATATGQGLVEIIDGGYGGTTPPPPPPLAVTITGSTMAGQTLFATATGGHA